MPDLARTAAKPAKQLAIQDNPDTDLDADLQINGKGMLFGRSLMIFGQRCAINIVLDHNRHIVGILQPLKRLRKIITCWKPLECLRNYIGQSNGDYP